MKTQYTLGFMFDPSMDQVVLLRKTKPEFQAGLLNGAGGTVSPFDESIPSGMCKEFLEETGVLTEVKDWILFSCVDDIDYKIVCFYCISSEHFESVTKTTEEDIVKARVSELRIEDTVSLVKPLIALALEHQRNKTGTTIVSV